MVSEFLPMVVIEVVILPVVKVIALALKFSFGIIASRFCIEAQFVRAVPFAMPAILRLQDFTRNTFPPTARYRVAYSSAVGKRQPSGQTLFASAQLYRRPYFLQ